jgi:hypothetical protein
MPHQNRQIGEASDSGARVGHRLRRRRRHRPKHIDVHAIDSRRACSRRAQPRIAIDCDQMVPRRQRAERNRIVGGDVAAGQENAAMLPSTNTRIAASRPASPTSSW